MSELISICIPVFNGAFFIEQTLKSIINQTYKNIEIIISDNASTDNTVDIINTFTVNDDRIQIIKNIKNNGYCNNIAIAVKEAKGDIICIFHADDVYESTIITKQHASLKRNINVAAVFTKSDTFSDSLESRTPNHVFTELAAKDFYNNEHKEFIGGIAEFAPVILEYGNVFTCPSFMTYKNTYDNIGGYKSDYPTNEDLDLWIRYLKDNRQLCILNETLLHYRISDSHASASLINTLDLPLEFQLIEEKLLPNWEFTESNITNYNRRKARVVLGKVIIAARKGKVYKTTELLKISRKIFRFLPWEKLGFLQLSPILDIIIYRFCSPILKLLRQKR